MIINEKEEGDGWQRNMPNAVESKNAHDDAHFIQQDEKEKWDLKGSELKWFCFGSRNEHGLMLQKVFCSLHSPFLPLSQTTTTPTQLFNFRQTQRIRETFGANLTSPNYGIKSSILIIFTVFK